uniref:Vomeronasal 2, receptor 72 n=1 Tax=Mus spicilegus TaxID=10103 RepID=A0A8C6I6J4_MUSSI
MFSLISVFWFLKISFIFCHLSDPKCFWRIKDTENKIGDIETYCSFSISTKPGYVKNGYFILEIIFSTSVLPKTNHLIFSVYLALEEINMNFHILPNISLVVNVECLRQIYDEKTGLALQSKEFIPNYSCTNERRYLIIFTAPIWAVTTRLGPFMFMYSSPELYCGHFHLSLSDNEQFPHLYQISPKDTSLPLAMVSLMVHFRWNWIGAMIINDDHGIQFLSKLREMQKHMVCLSFVFAILTEHSMVRNEFHKNFNLIVRSSAKVVIVYGDYASPIDLVLHWFKSKGLFRIWVSVSQFDMITNLGDFMLYSSSGTFIFSHQKPEISGFQKFIKTVYPSNYSSEFSFQLWWTYFRCSLPPSNCKTLKNCPTKTVFKWLFRTPLGMAMSDTCYNSYNAIHAVAHSLHEMLLQQVDMWSNNDGKDLEFDTWKMFSILKTLQFVNPAGNLVNMNQNLKQNTEYDIFYIMDFQKDYGFKMKIGRFSGHLPSRQQLYMSKEMMVWATDMDQILPSACNIPCRPGFRKSPEEEMDICCFVCNPCSENEISNMTNMDQCVKCREDQYANEDHTLCLQNVVSILDYREPLGKALAGFALCFSVLTSGIFCIFLKHRETPIFKANNQTLSYVLLISLIFCFICSLLYIGHPTTVICILQQTTFAIAFTVATSTILAKTITVLLAFKITIPGRRMRWLLMSGAPKYIILICTMIQLILCGIWLGTSPPYVDADVHMVHGHIIIVCNKGSVIAFYCVLGYMGSFALASFTVAFLARNLPDTFNEAKLLTFSMLVFCSVWITFIPVYQSTKGKTMVVVEVFCILASSAGLLLCIFAPKCYIILLRPHINSFRKFRKPHAKAENIS